MEMSGKHRARHSTMHIIRTSVVSKADDIRRPQSAAYRVNLSLKCNVSNSQLGL